LRAAFDVKDLEGWFWPRIAPGGEASNDERSFAASGICSQSLRIAWRNWMLSAHSILRFSCDFECRVEEEALESEEDEYADGLGEEVKFMTSEVVAVLAMLVSVWT
jgi:hypothetical protein